ncbi:MAG: STAS domain-containing protein [Wohlfahrtiimonas sp.]
MDACCTALSEQGSYRLNGDFNKFTIPENDQLIRALFKANAPLSLQLDGISSCDSALVALLISYKRDYPNLELTNPPEQLKKLLSLYNVEDWF